MLPRACGSRRLLVYYLFFIDVPWWKGLAEVTAFIIASFFLFEKRSDQIALIEKSRLCCSPSRVRGQLIQSRHVLSQLARIHEEHAASATWSSSTSPDSLREHPDWEL